MDAINSRNKLLLLSQIQRRYPQITFAKGDTFRWAATEKTIYYEPNILETSEGLYDLFHELSHAVLGHEDYVYDITLIQIEAEAWQRAKYIAREFGIQLSDNYAEESLETYRDWLTRRSACPRCEATGVQKNKRTYQCVNCRCAWRVNDAKFCALRRTATYAARSN